MRKLLLFLPLMLFLVLGVVLWRGLSLDPNAMPSALVGQPFPAFKLSSLENPERILTNADFQGKAMLVNVWATWCPSCRQEHPDLVALAQQQKLAIVGINYKDERPAAMQWLNTLGNPYLFNIFDDQGMLGLDLGVYGAPENYLVDAQGMVRMRHVGPMTPEVWQQMLGMINAN